MKFLDRCEEKEKHMLTFYCDSYLYILNVFENHQYAVCTVPSAITGISVPFGAVNTSTVPKLLQRATLSLIRAQG